jgi:hypothetical protein
MAAALGCLGLGVLLSTANLGWTQPSLDQDDATQTQPADNQQEGLDVLTRGPIHEAFAEPVNSRPQPGPVIPKQPPAPIEEEPPDQKPAGDNVQWFPGYWAWDDDRNDYIWVSGIWRIAPPDRQWVPGHWDQVQGGWQWSPGFWNTVQEDQVEYLPEPPAPVEAAPSTPQPNQDSVYIPGTWIYRQTRYVWRPGYWVDYRPGWVWIPAHYVFTPVGYVFVDGYWDFELERRGLCFAPVYFRRPLWRVASWVYRPQYVVYDDFIRGALFIRTGFSSYYFGDYFDAGYRPRGFTAFVDYRFGRTGYDPLYSYYRWDHREDRNWLRDLHGLYAGRFSGEIARPPRTLVQQNTLIQNIINNVTNINVTNVRNVTAIAPITKVDKRIVNLQPVPQQQRVQERRFVQSLRQASVQRAEVETKLVAQGGVPTRERPTPRVAQLSLPKTASAVNPVPLHRPPERPVEVHASSVTTRPEARPQTEPRPRTEPQPRPQPRPEPRPQPRVEPQPRTEPRPQPRPEPRPQPRTEPTPRPGTRPPERPEARPQPRPEPRPQPHPEARPQPRPEPRPQPHAEVQPHPEARPQPRPEPRPQPRAEPQPRPEPRPQPKPEPKPQPKPPSKPPQHPDRPPDHKQ